MPPNYSGLDIIYHLNSAKDQAKLHIPRLNTLPYHSSSFVKTLFECLPSKDIVTLFWVLLNEDRPLLFVSDRVNVLVPVISSLVALMHPFEWVLTNVPLLQMHPMAIDMKKLGFINNMQPIIIGIHRSAYSSMKRQVQDLKLVVVDLDLDLSEDGSRLRSLDYSDSEELVECEFQMFPTVDIPSVTDNLTKKLEDLKNLVSNQ